MSAQNAVPSHVKGAVAPGLIEETIGAMVERAAAQWPERDAIVSLHQGVRLTYRALNEQTDAIAAGLLALGMQPGDRIGIWSPNCVEWALTQFAAAKAGLILVTINPAYRISELEYTLNKVGVKALVAAERFKTSDYLGAVEELAPEATASAPGKLSAKRCPHLKLLIKIGDAARPGWITFSSIAGLAKDADRSRLAAITSELKNTDAINIQFTSGTTGSPKGATLSHRNILNNGYFVGRQIRLSERDRICVPVPLYHCFGMVMGNLAALTCGAAVIYPAEAFEPGAVLKAVEEEKCTALYGVPTMFIGLLAHPDFASFNLSTLRTGIIGGASCPVEVMRQIVGRMNLREITIAYGMTETSPVSFQCAVDDPIERRVSTIGRVQPHLEVKIIDSKGRVVPRGTPGELCTRGYSVMLGYWDDPEKTAEAVDADGWMHTGDIGVIDAEGYGNIVGRIKEMIIRGGENVYPREIEEFLFQHPKIEEVAIVGVPDAKFGEEICAWIRLKPGEAMSEAEIIAHCRANIAHYKAPRYVRFIESLPMTVTGKVQKFQIRQAMIDELGLVEAVTA